MIGLLARRSNALSFMFRASFVLPDAAHRQFVSGLLAPARIAGNGDKSSRIGTGVRSCSAVSLLVDQRSIQCPNLRRGTTDKPDRKHEAFENSTKEKEHSS